MLLQSAMALVFQLGDVYVNLQELSVLSGLFGHPVPPLIRLILPRFLYLIILYGTAFLILHRIWLFIRNKSFLPPTSFTQGPYAIFLISVISAALFFLILVLAFMLNEGLRGIANVFIIPATFLLPITVCWVELLSFKSGDRK